KSSQTRRSLANEAVIAVAESLPGDEHLSRSLAQELSQLRWLTDSELWQAACLTATAEESEQMQILLEKQQRQALTPSEQEQAQQPSYFFNRIMLVRAEAAVLLKTRGHDISRLLETT